MLASLPGHIAVGSEGETGAVPGQLAAIEKPARSSTEGWGPLHVTTQSPIQKARFAYLHQGSRLPPAGGLATTATLTWANVWDYRPGGYRVDAETWTANVLVEYGLHERLAVSLQVPAIRLGGGSMDGLIEGFHDLFNLGNMRRDEFPRDQLRAERYEPDGSTTVLIDGTDAGWYLRAPVLSARWRVTGPSSRLPVALKASVDFPDLEDRMKIVERDGHDWALGVSASPQVAERAWLTFSLAAVRSRPSPLGDGDLLREDQTSALAAVEYRLSDRVSLVGQLLHESPVGSATGGGFDRSATDFAFGARRQLLPAVHLELAFVENLFVHDNNVDFAFHAGITATTW